MATPRPDGGFPGTRGLGLGSFGWGSECSGMAPAPGVWGGSEDAGFDIFSTNYGHIGNLGFSARGTDLDHSMTCCKSNGDCVEMWGDNPENGHNFSESAAAKNFAADGKHWGVFIEPLPVTQLLHNTRDTCVGWTSTGPVCTPSVYRGPFGYYLGGPTGGGMAKWTVVADGGPQSVCQTVDAGTGMYAASGWLKAGSGIGAGRISMVGTGSSAGDRACTIASLSDAGQGRREGCMTTSPYGSGLTAIKLCFTAGAADNVSGVFGLSDAQLERDPSDYASLGQLAGLTSYILNDGGAGSTVTRSAQTYGFDPPPEDVNADSGCFGVGMSQRLYDSAMPYSAYGTWLAPSAGAYSLLQLPFLSDSYRSTDHDGHNLVTAYPGIISQGDGGSWFISLEWDGGAGGSVCQSYNGSLNCTSSDIAVLAAGAGINPGFTGATGGVWRGQYGPVIWGNGAQCRAEPPVTDLPGHRIYVIGDGWSGGGLRWNEHLYPMWSDTASQAVVVDPWAVESAVEMYEDAGCCNAPWGKIGKYGKGIDDSFAFWVGAVDIFYGMDGAQLFDDELDFVRKEARKVQPTGSMYWFNLPPTEGAHTAANRAFNTRWHNVCADGGFPGFSRYMTPEPGLVCIDAASVLAPDGGDYTLPALLDSHTGYLSDAGAVAVGTYFIARYRQP